MSLATLHHNLYETSMEGRVQADELLATVFERIVEVGLPAGVDVDINLDFQPTILYPDQAVPLTMFATESATNALKYLGRPETGAPWMSVTLTDHKDDISELEISNSTGERVNPAADLPSSRLGQQLITAYAQQLDGELETVDGGGLYSVRLRFRRPSLTDDDLSTAAAQAGKDIEG